MSTAWCAAIFAEHPWVLAHFDQAAQEEVWSGGPDVIVCMSIAASAQVSLAPAGFTLTGQWKFVSGCDHAQWFLLACSWDGAEHGEPKRGLMLVPRADLSIDHASWQVTGLRATGSKTVSVDGALVPSHRVLDLTAAPAPGSPRDVPALFRQPVGGTLGQALAAVALGGAEAALDLFRESAARRVLHLQGQVQAADPAAQLDLAEATVRIESARLLLQRDCEVVRALGRRSIPASPLEIAQLRLNKVHAVRECVAAIDRLFAASGGGALQDGHPLQRIWRDVHAVQAHAGLTWSNHARNYGSLAVGLPPTNRQLF
jgi:alkylation response protein AidB-like acyl-CoA dehydrogenase